MTADNPIWKLESRLRDRATVALVASVVLAIVAAAPLFFLVVIGFVLLVAARDAAFTELLFGTVVFASSITPAAFGFVQLHFYYKRRSGVRGHHPLFWWGSALVLNLAVTALGIAVAIAEPTIGLSVAIPMAALTFNAWRALDDESNLAAHQRWRDIVGDNLHTPIA